MPINIKDARELPRERREIEEALMEFLQVPRNAKQIASFLKVNVGGIYSKLIELESDGKIIRQRDENNLSFWTAAPT